MPDAHARTEQTKGGLLQRVMADLGDRRSLLVFLFVVLVVSNISLAFAPRVSEAIVNHLQEAFATSGVDTTWLLWMCLLLGVLYLVGYGSTGFVNRSMVSIAEDLTFKLRNRTQEKLNRLPIDYIDSHPAGDIVSILSNDVTTISSTLESSLPTLIGQGMLLVCVVAMMLVTNWLLALVYLITLPLTFFLTSLVAKGTRKLQFDYQTSLAKINASMSDTFDNHLIVKAFGCEGAKRREFDELNEDYYRIFVRSRFLSGFMIPLGAIANNVSFTVLCVFGGYLMLSGWLNLGVFTAFVFFGNMIGTPLSNMASNLNLLQSGIAAFDRVYGFLDLEEMPEEHPVDQLMTPEVQGLVAFDHVNFGYVPEKTLMNDVSLVARPGMTMAVVGPSGAGKTTLINLLMRFYEIDGGHIYLDGTDTRDISKENLRSAFGMVLQDTWIFNGTVAENIGYGKPNASRGEIVAAAKLVHCDEFIRKLPQGYDTPLSEEHSALSVGERQLLCIARTVLADPRILILDEATSNVDTKTEYLITQAMEEMMKSRTSFIIAHRLFTIRNADRIIFMVDGDIKEVGSHEELMAKRGLYHSMYVSASGGLEERDYEEAEEELQDNEGDDRGLEPRRKRGAEREREANHRTENGRGELPGAAGPGGRAAALRDTARL